MSKLTEVMDELESSLVEMTFQYLKVAMPSATKDQARNLVGKIGTRIMFGANLYDQALDKTMKRATPTNQSRKEL